MDSTVGTKTVNSLFNFERRCKSSSRTFGYLFKSSCGANWDGLMNMDRITLSHFFKAS